MALLERGRCAAGGRRFRRPSRGGTSGGTGVAAETSFRFLVLAMAFGLMALGLTPAVSGQGEKTTGFVWTDQFGTSVSDTLQDVALGADGVYVVGHTGGDLAGSSGGTDAFVRKYDADGNHVWTRQFGTAETDTAQAVAANATGVFVVGYTQGALEGSNAGSNDVFVRAYDAHGIHRWTRQFGTSANDFGFGVAVSVTGVYVAGRTTGSLNESNAGDFDGFVRKYDSDGNSVWTHQFGTSAFDDVRGVAAGGDDVFLVGYTQGDLAGFVGATDAFVRAYDADGTHLWTDQFGSSEVDYATAVDVENDALHVAGRTFGDLAGTNAGNFDAFLRVYDLDGSPAWTRQFGTPSSDQAFGVAADAGTTWVAGHTQGDLAGENLGSDDVFVRRYDADGLHLWTDQFGSTSIDSADGVAVGALGAYVVGDTLGNLPGHASSGSWDAYAVRLAETPDAPPSPTATARDGEVALRWEPPGYDGHLAVSAYRVYRGTDPADLQLVAVQDADLHTYVDRDVANGVTYHYAVGAVNGIGEGPPSALVSATPRAPPLLTVATPADGAVTNDPTVTVAGTTEADATVTINGTEVSVDSDGSFALTATQPQGTHAFTVEATNPIELTTTVTVSVTVDTTAPGLALTSPAAGVTVTSPTVLLEGTTDPDARVVANGLAIDVAADGSFALRLPLAEGANAIAVTATDPAGNTATVTRTVTYANPVPGLEQELEDSAKQIAALGVQQAILAAVAVAFVAIATILGVAYLQLRRGKPAPWEALARWWRRR